MHQQLAGGDEGMAVPDRLRYDFRIGGREVGDFVIEDDGVTLRQWVRFQMEDGEQFENQYLVRYSGSRVHAYRVGDEGWVDCSELPDDHYPTAAYPLVLRQKLESYLAIDEGTGEVRPRSLDHVGDRVVERQGGEMVRTFELRNGVVARIDWGGATSSLLAPEP